MYVRTYIHMYICTNKHTYMYWHTCTYIDSYVGMYAVLHATTYTWEGQPLHTSACAVVAESNPSLISSVRMCVLPLSFVSFLNHFTSPSSLHMCICTYVCTYVCVPSQSDQFVCTMVWAALLEGDRNRPWSPWTSPRTRLQGILLWVWESAPRLWDVKYVRTYVCGIQTGL